MEWFLCVTGVSLSLCGLFAQPPGIKLTLEEGSLVLIGVLFIIMGIAKIEGVWPFNPDKKPAPKPAFSNLRPDEPAFMREPLRRRTVMIAHRRKGGG